MWQKLANGLMFNLSWLLIVGGQSGLLAWGVAALHLAVHFAWLGRGRAEWTFIAGFSVFGLLLDRLLFIAGVLVAPGGAAPLWISALWPVLGTTAAHAFSGLARHPLVAAVVGAVGGLLSYRLGASLSDIAFGTSPLAEIVLLGLWAILFPLMLVVARRLTSSIPGNGHVARA